MCIPHTYVLQCTEYEYEITHMTYSPFHKTLPSSILEMHWISARFFEMGDKMSNVYNVQCIHTKSKYAVYSLYSTLNTVNCTVFSVHCTTYLLYKYKDYEFIGSIRSSHYNPLHPLHPADIR